ncbi:MAG: hypothetical protein R3C10_22650 [Pirellulales bacterium]
MRRYKAMTRVVLPLVGMLVAVVAFAEFGEVAVCDGWYDLTVTTVEECAEGVSRVSYIGAHNAETARSFAADIDGLFNEMWHIDSVEPFAVTVGYSFRASQLLGRTWDHSQEHSHLVVVLDRFVSTRRIYLVAIPHRDISRDIVVSASGAI